MIPRAIVRRGPRSPEVAVCREAPRWGAVPVAPAGHDDAGYPGGVEMQDWTACSGWESAIGGSIHRNRQNRNSLPSRRNRLHVLHKQQFTARNCLTSPPLTGYSGPRRGGHLRVGTRVGEQRIRGQAGPWFGRGDSGIVDINDLSRDWLCGMLPGRQAVEWESLSIRRVIKWSRMVRTIRSSTASRRPSGGVECPVGRDLPRLVSLWSFPAISCSVH